jgi:hemoglobin-like flavoprotein
MTMVQVATSHYQIVSEFLLNDVVTIISVNDVLNVVR